MPPDSAAGSKARAAVMFAPVAQVAGTLLLPASSGKPPCVVILPDSGTDGRNGGQVRSGSPKRDVLKQLASRLAEAGYASLRYDRVGYGGSIPTENWRGTYSDELQVARAAIGYARRLKELGKVIVLAEGDGAYLACLAAEYGGEGDAYVLLNPPCGPPEDLYEYRYGRLAASADGSDERRAWAERALPLDLALGRDVKGILAAAAAGKQAYDLGAGDFRTTVSLARLKELLDRPFDAVYRLIQAPSFVVTAEKDAVTPPACSQKVVQLLKEGGVADVTAVEIPGADHSFQRAATDEDARLRERYTPEGAARPVEPRLYAELLSFLKRLAPAPALLSPSPAPVLAAPTEKR